MSVKLVPSHKSDLEAARALLAASPEQVAQHAAALLEWLQDPNWPVSPAVATALSRCTCALVEPVRAVLRGRDAVWKQSILDMLLHVEPSVRIALSDDILRLINEPTADDIAESVPEAARDVFFLLVYNDTPPTAPAATE